MSGGSALRGTAAARRMLAVFALAAGALFYAACGGSPCDRLLDEIPLVMNASDPRIVNVQRTPIEGGVLTRITYRLDGHTCVRVSEFVRTAP